MFSLFATREINGFSISMTVQYCLCFGSLIFLVIFFFFLLHSVFVSFVYISKFLPLDFILICASVHWDYHYCLSRTSFSLSLCALNPTCHTSTLLCYAWPGVWAFVHWPLFDLHDPVHLWQRSLRYCSRFSPVRVLTLREGHLASSTTRGRPSIRSAFCVIHHTDLSLIWRSSSKFWLARLQAGPQY